MVFMDLQLCIDDPSKTFWDDPKMYVDDPGLDTLLSLTTDELLLSNSNLDVTANDVVTEKQEKILSKKTRNEQKQSEDKTNNGRQTLVCIYPNCNKTYLKPSHLKVHMRRHSGEKPYGCMWPGCAWRFSRSDELSRHCRSHSGIKPYGCDVCEKRFSRSDHLAKHARVHHRRMAAAAEVAARLQWPLQQQQYYHHQQRSTCMRVIDPTTTTVTAINYGYLHQQQQ